MIRHVCSVKGFLASLALVAFATSAEAQMSRTYVRPPGGMPSGFATGVRSSIPANLLPNASFGRPTGMNFANPSGFIGYVNGTPTSQVGTFVNPNPTNYYNGGSGPHMSLLMKGQKYEETTLTKPVGTTYTEPAQPRTPPPAAEPKPPAEPKPLVANSTGRLEVFLPTADAELWINEQKVIGTGLKRVLDLPITDPSKPTSYKVKASWKDGEKVITKEQTVALAGGTSSIASFLAPAK